MHIKLPIGIKTIAVLSIVAMLIILVTGTLTHPTNNSDTELAAQIDQLLADTFKPTEPGAAVIVIRDGEMLLRIRCVSAAPSRGSQQHLKQVIVVSGAWPAPADALDPLTGVLPLV